MISQLLQRGSTNLDRWYQSVIVHWLEKFHSFHLQVWRRDSTRILRYGLRAAFWRIESLCILILFGLIWKLLPEGWGLMAALRLLLSTFFLIALIKMLLDCLLTLSVACSFAWQVWQRDEARRQLSLFPFKVAEAMPLYEVVIRELLARTKMEDAALMMIAWEMDKGLQKR